MAYYRTSKCPYCKSVINSFERSFWNDFEADFGEPFGICENCGGQFKTGKNYWENMSNGKKKIIYFKLLISILIQPLYILLYIGLATFILSLIFPKVINLNGLEETNPFIISGVLLLIFFFSTRSLINDFKKIKEKFKRKDEIKTAQPRYTPDKTIDGFVKEVLTYNHQARKKIGTTTELPKPPQVHINKERVSDNFKKIINQQELAENTTRPKLIRSKEINNTNPTKTKKIIVNNKEILLTDEFQTKPL